jgi:glycerate 2-kinase
VAVACAGLVASPTTAMKIVVALDKFKGSLSALDACSIVASAFRESLQDAEIIERPLADGGDGTASILQACCGGAWREMQVTGPLMGSSIRAGYARLSKPAVNVVEMASASGIALLRSGELNPMVTTTMGTGELLAAAMSEGRPVWLAVGGSATVDAGIGAATALGWKFLNHEGCELPPIGGSLVSIDRIVPPACRYKGGVEILCDVANPLCGPVGAARFFGPQKGATPSMVEELERGMENFAAVVRRDFGVDLLTLPGGGAAGGLPAGFHFFCGASLRSGIETIMDAVDMRACVRNADWVVTGEGSFDAQSLGGKVVSGVLNVTQGSNARIGVLAGRIELSAESFQKAGIAAALALVGGDVSPSNAMRNARVVLHRRALEFARTHIA